MEIDLSFHFSKSRISFFGQNNKSKLHFTRVCSLPMLKYDKNNDANNQW